MTSELREPRAEYLRADLAAVVIDGDIVVYDAQHRGSHVLSGGAVAVWMALEDGGVRGVVDRVADAVGLEPAVLAEEIRAVLQSFRDLGLFEESTPTHHSDGPTDGAGVGG